MTSCSRSADAARTSSSTGRLAHHVRSHAELSGAADIDDETVENRDSRLASITSFDELLSKSERARHTAPLPWLGRG